MIQLPVPPASISVVDLQTLAQQIVQDSLSQPEEYVARCRSQQNGE
jgi:hypothetical protein